MSAVLTTFPWATDFLVKDIHTIITDRLFSVSIILIWKHSDIHFMKAYMDSIVQLESNVETSQDGDPEAARLRVALCRVLPGSSQFPAQTSLKRHQAIRLCEVMCAYRLIDVLYQLQGQDPLDFQRPMYSKQRISDYLPTQVRLHPKMRTWL
jgi:hypothetical protein